MKFPFLAALGLSVVASAATFRIGSPKQTSRSVLLAWETDQQVRTLRAQRGWSPSTPTGPTHKATIAAGEGRAGTAAAKVVGTTSEKGARGCFIQDMPDLREQGKCTYSLFYRTADQKGGYARALIDCYVGEKRTHHGLVNARLAPSEAWREATGTFELPPDVRLTRILVYQMGAGTTWFDDVRISRAGSAANLVGDGGFGDRGSWRVLFRKKGEAKWQKVNAVVLERFHNVIFLEPGTAYEFQVKRLAADGKVLEASQVVAASTTAVQERVWQGLRLGLDQRTPTPPAVYPCIESVGGKLYYSQSRGGCLWLTELDDQFKANWTKRWVKPFLVDGRGCYQGQTQTAVLGHKLYISWKRAWHGDAIHARQCVASYDVRTGEIGEPFVVEPDDAKHSTWNGGIAAVKGELWVSYCLWRKTAGGYRTTVTVRRLNYEGRKLGPAFELNDQPTDTPYTPFLSVFNDELVACFTDTAAKADAQALWLVRFDGTRFHDLMTVSPTGFNQYAKGIQHGGKLLLVWKYGAPYPSRIYGRYMFHDIGLALVDPVAKTVELTSLADDIKYNSSPDIIGHKGRYIYVYNKFEHLYGRRGDSGELYGCFIGALTPMAPGR